MFGKKKTKREIATEDIEEYTTYGKNYATTCTRDDPLIYDILLEKGWKVIGFSTDGVLLEKVKDGE